MESMECHGIHQIPLDSMLTNQLNILSITIPLESIGIHRIPLDSMDSNMEVCGSVKY